MKLVPLIGKQKVSIRHSYAHGNVWEGAVRSSKTICSILRWLMFVRAAAPGPLAMVGKTTHTLYRNVIEPIEQIVGRSRCIYRPVQGELILLGRKIYLVSANNKAEAEKVKGMTLVGFYGDELTTWPEEVFNMLTTRLSAPGAQWFGTTNPAGNSHWLMEKWLKFAKVWVDHTGRLHRREGEETKDLNRFSFTLDDNPTLEDDFVARLKSQYSGVFYRRNILGHWIAAEGAIYDMWDPQKHIVKALPPIQAWISTGIDYGTKNPFDALLLGLGKDRKLYLASEYRYDSRITKRQKTMSEYSAEYRNWLDINQHGHYIRPRFHCIDPSAAYFFEQLQRDGVRGLTAADNRVDDGIRLVSNLIAQDLLFAHESCTGWIEEIDGYVWDDKATEKGEDKPLKQDDHAMDAGRYAINTTMSIWRHELAKPQLELAA